MTKKSSLAHPSALRSLHEMATRIVLVQHGEKAREPGDPRLTEVGHRQVADTARWIESRYGRSIARVFSSPLRRARETAAPIAHHLGTEVSIDDRLVERMNWSVESGLDLPTFLAEWDRASSDRSYQPAIGESSTATGERMLAALHDVSATHPECTVVVATHGGATVDLLRTLLGDAAVEERVPGLIAEGPESCAITVLGRSTTAGCGSNRSPTPRTSLGAVEDGGSTRRPTRVPNTSTPTT